MDFNILKNNPAPGHHKETVMADDIAIIGINAQIGQTKDAEEFWEALCGGQDLIRDFPNSRYEDADKIHTILHGEPMNEKIVPCAYMDRIDVFHHALFQLSKTEAEYMSPMQKIFLESAWQAIEDGGYGGGKIKDSNTGIYLGYSASENPFGEALALSDPEAKGIVVSGNVNSIIASRISYLLNLTGPALLIDTACSSSLAALHIACNQLENKEVDMALVGGIRVMVLPRMEHHNMLGVESKSSHARTFDDMADGTGGGEGVICFLLKRTSEAQKDGDHIYAVIKGSAMNQDGASIGLTAPSDDAQAAVMQAAWKKAKVNPYDISYIEAHGTATQLGDTLEVSGLTKAFSQFTDHRQFCAVGAVKTNVGHLDAAAGLTGLLKTILMLNHKMIPPTVGFYVPNHEINFADSPVYVADQLRPWKSVDQKSKEKKRLCGVSSFGISGTNCHVILEEAPRTEKNEEQTESKTYLLTISDETKEKLQNRITEYKKWLTAHPDTSFADFCYSANYGRHVFNCRFYACLGAAEEFLETDYDLSGIYENYGYHEFKISNTGKDQASLSQSSQDELTRNVQKMLTETICEKGSEEYKNLLCEIGKKYIAGADISWTTLYRGEPRMTIQIPVHQYKELRCWPKLREPEKITRKPGHILHPLIDELLVDSYHMRIYQTKFSIQRCWELREHKINDVHVLVGTAFIEMAHFVASDYFHTKKLVLQNLIFYHALISKADEITDVQSIVKQEGDILKIGFYSKHAGKWKCYMEVEAKKSAKIQSTSVDIEMLKEQFGLIDFNQMPVKSKDHIVNIDGVRWSNIEHVWKGEHELLIKFNLNESLKKEKNKYFLYPSLLDPAINSGNMLIDDMFLPYSCGQAEFYERLPDIFYSNIQRKQRNSSEEFSLFKITFYSETGDIIGCLDDYVIKRVNQIQSFLRDHNSEEKKKFHKVIWKKQKPLHNEKNSIQEVKTLLLGTSEQVSGKWAQIFDSAKTEIAETGTDYEALMEHFDYERIICLSGIEPGMMKNVEEIEHDIKYSVKQLFSLVKAMLKAGIRQTVEIILLTNHYGTVTENDEFVNPVSRALAGMGLCVDHEYDHINVRVIDIEENVDKSVLFNEIEQADDQKITALRMDGRYAEVICESEQLASDEMKLRNGGVYIIAGGLGGMGLAYCRKLCSENKDIKIILMNRTYSEADIKNEINAHHLGCKKAGQLKQLWDENHEIHVVQCDISDEKALEQTLKRIREQFQRVDGIINAAGIAGDGFMINKSWEEFEHVLQPKVSGSLNLHRLTKDDDLQFFIMCSSMTTLFGAPGQSDYTAANAFLDGFAEYRKLSGLPALAIDWTGWNESGMAVTHEVDTEDKFVRFVSDSEGAEMMYQALSLPDSRILAGKFNYSNLKKQVERYKGIIMLSEEINLMQENNSCEEKEFEECGPVDISELIITGKPTNALTQTEKHVISAWVQTLQVKEVDINEKFFEVGGNSLLVAYLHKEIDRYYPKVLTITDLFLYSTVSEIAGFIEERQKKEDVAEASDLENLLDMLVSGEMEIEDVNEQIKI